MILDKLGARRAATAIALACSIASSSCTSKSAPAAPPPGARMFVACTISTLCSLVSAVAGDKIDLHGIVPVGASAETFEPTPSDIVAVSRARVIFENGLGLEAWMDNALASASAADIERVTLSDAVAPSVKASGNPHLWLDPVYARAYVHSIAVALERADPRNASAYAAGAQAEVRRLTVLERWIRARIATIPPERRAMICFHDAWFYFDRRFGIKNVGAIEPSPGREPSPGYFAKLIALAKANHVRAVFAEPQYSPKLAQTLQAGAGIRVLSDLYDDTLGPQSGLTDYETMMRYDVDAIVSALRA
jgi:manganese/iron transport system substrate-binding protein